MRIKQKETSRLRWLICLACVVLYGLLPVANAATSAAPRLVFISHAPDSDKWWNIIRNGLKHAGEDFGVEVDYKNPPTGDLKDMVKLIDESSTQDYRGMIVTLADFDLLKEPLQRVIKQKKMPVITVNSGTQQQSESIGALMHIGQPELFAGEMAGEKARRANIKSFVCLNHNATNASSHERCKGFAAGLGPNANAVTLELDGDPAAMQAKITKYLDEHPNTEAMLALGSTSAHPALEAIKATRSGKIPYFVTFDLSSQISTGIRSGAIAFAIDQQPYLQAYLPVALLVEYNKMPDASLDAIKVGAYVNPKLSERMAVYDLNLLPSKGRHINSGPAFVTKINIGKVDQYSGQYR
ncbi:MAG: sugar ABC transporter substrate-binding protein [Propionivibrio sp.]